MKSNLSRVTEKLEGGAWDGLLPRDGKVPRQTRRRKAGLLDSLERDSVQLGTLKSERSAGLWRSFE